MSGASPDDVTPFPFLFSLAIHPMLVQARLEFQSVLTPSYLDDITILGPISVVTDTYWKLKGHNIMSNIGLELREEKRSVKSIHHLVSANVSYQYAK